jgi:hypothetical protein
VFNYLGTLPESSVNRIIVIAPGGSDGGNQYPVSGAMDCQRTCFPCCARSAYRGSTRRRRSRPDDACARLKSLMFEFMPEDQAARIATVLIQVAADLRRRLSRMHEPTEWHLELADWLSTLEMLLHDLVI